MKYLFTFIFTVLWFASFAQFGKYFSNQTLRIDYYHSGNFEDEYITPDEFISEPTWGGSKKNLIDPFDFGTYKFMVYDSVTSKLIYSRGYSSLFYEYRDTEEAKTTCGNFSESIIMPFPKKTIKVEFYSRNKDLEWQKKLELFVNPASPEIKTKTDVFYPMQAIHKSGKPNKKLDIVFLPEGYTEAQMDSFKLDCRKFAGYILDMDPFKFNTKKINIWAVLAPSEESGTDIPGDSILANTLLNSTFYTFGSERYLTTSDYKSVRNLASNAPYDQIIILVNQKKYGGGGIYNFYTLATTGNEYSDFLVQHEFGHALAGLADEYYTSDVAVQDFYKLDKEPWEPNLTTLVNFNSKWRDLVDPSTPIPTPATDEYKGRVGVFEGGGYQAKGIYRPYIDCSMNVIQADHFCPVCKRAIKRMIDFYCK
jgi:hypothetical protein